MTPAQAFVREHFVNEYGRKDFELLGEVIGWELYGVSIKYVDLESALSTAGLDTKIARRLLPRYAFVRAARKMSENRIIKQVVDANGKLVFQFTKEYLDGEHYKYDFETDLTLDKETGAIDCPHQELRELAQRLLAEAIENRTTADVTRVIKRLFEKQADLFPVKADGGVYFVPDKYSDFVDRVGLLVSQLNGKLIRMPIPAGTKHGDQTVQDAINAGLEAVVEEHAKAVAEFGVDNRLSTLERHLRKIDATKFKVQSYGSLLEDRKQKLEERLAVIQVELRQKVQAVMAAQVED